MRVLLASFGSRGDVQPIIALGKGLQAAGYRVSLGVGQNFEREVVAAGLGFEPFHVDMQRAVNSGVGKQWITEGSRNPRKEMAAVRALAQEHAPQITQDLLRMGAQHDVFLSGLMTLAPLSVLAQQQGKAAMALWLAPFLATRSGTAGAQAPFPHQDVAPNRWFGLLVETLMADMFGAPFQQMRAQLGLPPAKPADFRAAINNTPSLCGFSPRVVPPPPDWNPHHHITGYWHTATRPSDWTPPQALQTFLDAGTPPVFIGFGSMSSADPARTLQTFLDALAQAGKRGILQSGWAGLSAANLPAHVHLLESAPHDWLFPRMAAVVHHGGAGTTATALRAGVPALVVAHIGDQPYWGRRVFELGVGAPPLRIHQLTAARLAQGIRAMDDPAMQQRAAAFGAQLAQEDGIAQAVAVFQRYHPLV